MTFANGGVGKSKAPVTDDGKIIAFKDTGAWQKDGGDRISEDCKKHVKATSKVWMHKTPSLSGKKLLTVPKGKKVTLTGKVGLDTCNVLFFQVKYGGKTGYISEGYLDLPKSVLGAASEATYSEGE